MTQLEDMPPHVRRFLALTKVGDKFVDYDDADLWEHFTVNIPPQIDAADAAVVEA